MSLTELNALLLTNRGYISKLPENRYAVMVISGGLDSVATAARAMEEYHCRLFPLFFSRGQQALPGELASVKYYTTYFQKRYGADLFRKPIVLNVDIPALELKSTLKKVPRGYPLRNLILYSYAVQYAAAVSITINEPVRSIFCGALYNDYSIDNNLDTLRSNTIATCINMQDWSWNITSPNSDPCISKSMYDKTKLIQWAAKHNISLEKSISCCSADNEHQGLNCGLCKFCKQRQEAYVLAGVPDDTRYLTPRL